MEENGVKFYVMHFFWPCGTSGDQIKVATLSDSSGERLIPHTLVPVSDFRISEESCEVLQISKGLWVSMGPLKRFLQDFYQSVSKLSEVPFTTYFGMLPQFQTYELCFSVVAVYWHAEWGDHLLQPYLKPEGGVQSWIPIQQLQDRLKDMVLQVLNATRPQSK